MDPDAMPGSHLWNPGSTPLFLVLAADAPRALNERLDIVVLLAESLSARRRFEVRDGVVYEIRS